MESRTSVDVPSIRDVMDFNGQVIIVTGGGSGIGAGIARRFAEASADLIIHYRSNIQGAQNAVREAEKMGVRAIAFRADLTIKSEVDRLFEATLEHFGRLDVLVNNAGIYPRASLFTLSEEEWDEVIAVNLRSVFLCTQAAAKHMVSLGIGGSVINISSIEGVNPAQGHSHYGVSKSGVLTYTRAAALEFGQHGIRVNAVSPGLIWRQGIEKEWAEGVERWKKKAPLARLGLPEDVADACLFLASRASRWITGVNLIVDGGISVRQYF